MDRLSKAGSRVRFMVYHARRAADGHRQRLIMLSNSYSIYSMKTAPSDVAVSKSEAISAV
jgi:hypothetical protein